MPTDMTSSVTPPTADQPVPTATDMTSSSATPEPTALQLLMAHELSSIQTYQIQPCTQDEIITTVRERLARDLRKGFHGALRLCAFGFELLSRSASGRSFLQHLLGIPQDRTRPEVSDAQFYGRKAPLLSMVMLVLAFHFADDKEGLRGSLLASMEPTMFSTNTLLVDTFCQMSMNGHPAWTKVTTKLLQHIDENIARELARCVTPTMVGDLRTVIETTLDMFDGDSTDADFLNQRTQLLKLVLRLTAITGSSNVSINPTQLYSKDRYKLWGDDLSAFRYLLQFVSGRLDEVESGQFQWCWYKPTKSSPLEPLVVSADTWNGEQGIAQPGKRGNRRRLASRATATIAAPARAPAEAERIAAEKVEAERIAAETAEAERIAAEKAEANRIAAEKAEAERIAAAEAKAIAEAEAIAKAIAEAKAKAEAERTVSYTHLTLPTIYSV